MNPWILPAMLAAAAFALDVSPASLNLGSGSEASIAEACTRVVHYRDETVSSPPRRETRFRLDASMAGAAGSPEEACPASSSTALLLSPDSCLTLTLAWNTWSEFAGAPFYPSSVHAYLLPASSPSNHGPLGRDDWPQPVISTTAFSAQESRSVCPEEGTYRLAVRACLYHSTPPSYADRPATCEGTITYDINSDDGGFTPPIYRTDPS